MILENTISITIQVIQGCVSLAKNTIYGTVKGIFYLLTHLPEVLKMSWQVFKASLELGQLLMTFSLKALKYVVLNFPKIVKGLFEFSFEILKNLPEFIELVAYTLPKIFFYEIPKAVGTYLINHLPAVANWLVRHFPELIAQGVGIMIGVVYAPFKITFDLLHDGFDKVFKSNSIPNDASRSNDGLEITEELAMAIVENFEQDIAVEYSQSTYAPHFNKQSSDNSEQYTPRSENNRDTLCIIQKQILKS